MIQNLQKYQKSFKAYKHCVPMFIPRYDRMWSNRQVQFWSFNIEPEKWPPVIKEICFSKNDCVGFQS